MTFEKFREMGLMPIYPATKYVYRVDVVSVIKPIKEIFDKKDFITDDRYKVLCPYRFPLSLTPRYWDVFPISFPLPLSICEEPYETYQKYILGEGQIEEMDEECNFQELLDML